MKIKFKIGDKIRFIKHYNEDFNGIEDIVIALDHEGDPITKNSGTWFHRTLNDVAELVEGDNRKDYPIYSGVLKYFPDALWEVSKVSKSGNEQHNPGEPLNWNRNKSTDQLDASVRHLTDHAKGIIKDEDGVYSLARSIWRQCAELQLLIESENDKKDI